MEKLSQTMLQKLLRRSSFFRTKIKMRLQTAKRLLFADIQSGIQTQNNVILFFKFSSSLRTKAAQSDRLVTSSRRSLD